MVARQAFVTLSSVIRRWRGPIGTVIAIVTGIWLVRTLWFGFADAQIALSTARIPWLLASIAVFAIGHFVGGFNWWLLLHGLGGSLPFREAMRIHLVATPAKYLPGPAWNVTSKVAMATAAGVPITAAGASATVELAGFVAFGAILALVSTLFRAQESDVVVSLIAVLVIAGAFVLAALIVPLALDRSLIKSLRPGWLLASAVVILLEWPLVMAAIGFTAASLAPLGFQDIGTIAFATLISFLGSIMVILAPAGFGVREGLLTLTLGAIMPTAVAGVVAIVTRVLMMTIEAVGFLIARRM